MSFARLVVCIGGVYAMFLLWAIAQERLSVPFATLDDTSSDRFSSALMMGTVQSFLSSLSALLYLLFRRAPNQTSLSQALGLPPPNSPARTTLLLRYLQCSVFITSAAPFGFAALSYISYPAMVLGKSCKLVPVMIMNLLLYRRKFAPHKYLVVLMVTLGITLFMHYGGGGKGNKSRSSSSTEYPSLQAQLMGTAYLLINLALDGATNSTQDEIFQQSKSLLPPSGISGQQMMFWINLFSTLLTTVLSVLPLPYIPVLHPSHSGGSELRDVIEFVRRHKGVLSPLMQFGMTGALGQLFIFETLAHFGSLTLVTITLTRKLFTMLLSVVVYKHRLMPGQWLGAAVVFAGISVEAWVKRRDVHTKRVIQEKEKAKLKSL